MSACQLYCIRVWEGPSTLTIPSCWSSWYTRSRRTNSKHLTPPYLYTRPLFNDNQIWFWFFRICRVYFGHLSAFCGQSENASICTDNHSFWRELYKSWLSKLEETEKKERERAEDGNSFLILYLILVNFEVFESLNTEKRPKTAKIRWKIPKRSD